jgi:uncharacterized protein
VAFFEWRGNNLLLNIHVQTRAKENAISGLHGERLKLRINAPPVDNKANQHIINYLANEFSVKQSGIELISGLKHRDKQILIKQPGQLPDWFNNLSDST